MIYSSDEKVLKIIENCLRTIEEYHNQIFEMELYIMLYQNSYIDREDYGNKVLELGSKRSVYHNALIGNVNVLNRMADKNNLSPVYDGIVDYDKAHRREVGNSTLEFVEDIIKNRC
jgi:hypothetical protein